ncbi:MAG: hypothetical protein JW715_11930 [Sedimentisphaerales bacterium]|nr:hypothetical protein [Sedimentisphaerales bacterium]
MNRNDNQNIKDNPVCVSTEALPEIETVVSALAGLAAAWIAAGSTGLLSHPLRRVLTLLALAVIILAQRPSSRRKITHFVALPVMICIVVCMIILYAPVYHVMSISLIMAFVAITSNQKAKRTLLNVSVAVIVFAIYRMANTSIPCVWSFSDMLGRFLGYFVGFVSERPVYAGATFAGLDYLVLMIIFWFLWTASGPKPGKARAIYGLTAILGGHFCYLIILSFVPNILSSIPEPTSQAGFSWAALFHKAVPWNLPILAFGINLTIAAAMLRWSRQYQDNENFLNQPVQSSRIQYILVPATVIVAVIIPVILALFPGKLSLEGKKVVFYEKGFLNWLKPEHGQYGRLSSGMYGMLPVYIESLGAKTLISPELSAEDLSDADVLVLLFPDESWADGQLECIWEFVKNGGSLLVMAEHTTRDSDGGNRFNEVLEPTNIRVEFDSATFAVGGWLQSYEAIAHPATTGIQDERNQFGVVIGASLEIGWPARPLLIGRWGWSDMGDQGSSRAMMGNGEYDSGEKLGDLILAAEQPLGKGRIIAFGDTSGLTNAINVSTYEFNSRLFGYLAGNKIHAHPAGRQFPGILFCVILAGILIWKPSGWKTIAAILCLSGSLIVSNKISQHACLIFPDGNYKTPNNLAYVDASHLEAYSPESWRPDGVGGLILTLMRNDYLPFSLFELTTERIMKADLLISIAPSRSFSRKERKLIRDFVIKGGTLVIMAGLDRAGPSRSLLSSFGFNIGSKEQDSLETEPMGHFKSPYLSSGDQYVFVRFYAAWPVYCNDPNARIIANGRNNQPVIIMRKLGAGKVVVIGDTCFAMNKNLEWEGGESFEGMRENADFWRWFITQLRDQQMWIPPALQKSGSETQSDESIDNTSGREVAN